MHTAYPTTDDAKREALQKLHRKHLERMKKKYTGKTICHWKDGEIKKVEILYTESV